MGGATTYPFQVVPLVSFSTDGGGGTNIQQKSDGVEALMGESEPATRVGSLMRSWDKAWSI